MRLVKRFLAALGYDLHRTYRERETGVLFDDFLQMLYRSEAPGDARFRAPLSLCVDALGYSFSAAGFHPYCAALREYAQGGVATYEESLLQRYYAEFQPASAAELFGLSGGGTGGHGADNLDPLSDYPPDTHLTPWLAEPIDQRLGKTKGVLEREFGPGSGRRSPGDREAPGHPLFGPVSDEQGRQEYSRLISVYESMMSRGFELPRERREDLQVLALRREEEFRFLVLAGKHRVAAASVLGLDSAPVRLRRPVVIDRRDALRWPLVESGVWELEEALVYFDALFEAEGRGNDAPGLDPSRGSGNNAPEQADSDPEEQR
ncbi:MAG: hypothetical protein ACOCWS_02775 [Alkalispirochaetaceae bacterium]